VDVAARLAWTPTRSASAPPPGTVTGDPACRAHAGAWKPKSDGPAPSARSPMLPADLAEARPLLSAAKRLRLPR